VIERALKKLLKERMAIIIAHRLSMIGDANNIIEQGTHEERMRKRGTYYELIKVQYKMLVM
jgi:ATP-binding cassette subfamily B multidrug efflux pump